uniref:Breast cancer anti-estrogen resistance protein 3 n=1 Tax=Schizaphis graminum TaxID=13262 RepID=A0A2S2PNV6_SCHGA
MLYVAPSFRFACLQYLVAMTVIVTPCLLLIGSDINDKENLADVNLEWSLEDEYEYRRRRFYYRCAGFSSWLVSDNDSTSDDDDDSYKLTANSDIDSGYSLPPREEWAVEKRHWLDLLTRHRAAALDKWIRTAADAKQAVGDVYGYRALMSALCSDRIQALQDTWATLRRVHTATAVAFESRLRPEFLGRGEKNLMTTLGKPGINDVDDNDVNELLQLPPNATIPDATSLAVLYEHLYTDNISDAGSVNSTAVGSNDIGSKKEKDPRLSSFFTSPLLLSPSPWLSLKSGISGGLGSSMGSDYGLSALHFLCIQYSDWVQQSYGDDNSILPLIKSPVLQLDRFRSNFRALLRQYSGGDFSDYDDGDVRFNYVSGYKDIDLQREENTSYHKEFNYNRNDEFAYERQYEDNVEEYGTGGDDNEDCGDDDDDDATVICCNNESSILVMKNDAVDTSYGDTLAAAKTENQRQTTTKNEKCFNHKKYQEEDNLYDRWIEDASVNGRGPAPLNIVFCTELHVRLFWPPTLFLQDINDNKDTIDHKSAIPAYALGTTYVATVTAAFDDKDKFTNHVPSPLTLNHEITGQLDQAAQDMRLRYKAMDDFLDRACAYSTSATKIAY